MWIRRMGAGWDGTVAAGGGGEAPRGASLSAVRASAAAVYEKLDAKWASADKSPVNMIDHALGQFPAEVATVLNF